jgi:hypothetical protein
MTEVVLGSSRPHTVARPARRTMLAAGLLVLAAGLAANSLLGPLVLDAFGYHVGETLRNQMLGLDFVSLAVVSPLAGLAGVLVLRGHDAGAPLTLAVGEYTAYMFVQYVVGPDYVGLPGDSQVLFPLYLGLFVLGWATALAAWNVLDAGRAPWPLRRPRLVGGVVLPLLAVLTFSRYLPALADAMSAEPQQSGYLAGPTFFWTIALMDLGVFLPATVVACVGLVRGKTWSAKAAYAVVGWLGLVGPAVAGMSVAMSLNDDPTASTTGTAFMCALGLVFAVLAVVIYRPLFRAAPP